MANPLKELELVGYGFQFIQEVPIGVPPAKAWEAVVNPEGWFKGPGLPPAKCTLELWPGGRWYLETADGGAGLLAQVTHIEPRKVLRVSGSFGMTHLPVSMVMIFELQPANDGKTTVLRVGQRTFGYMDKGAEGRFRGGWQEFLPKIKALAEAAA
jgi:uncharacterized protein YndB with AHSA1/START domain